MPRQRHAALVALLLTGAAAIALASAAFPTIDAWRFDAPAPASAGAARAPVTITLDSGAIAWRVAPYADVGAWWYAGDSFYYSAFGTADSTGHVLLTWTDRTPERTDDDRPFDEATRLVLGTGVGLRDTYTVTLPALDAEIDAPGDRIVLRGPAGATLAVRVRRAMDRDALGLTAAALVGAAGVDGGGALAGERAPSDPGRSVWAGSVTADRDGAAELSLAGTVDIQPGDGVEVQRTFAGDSFVLHRTAFQLVLGGDGRGPMAYGRPGAAVALTVRGRDGRERRCPTVIGLAGRSAWTCGAAIAAGDRVTATHNGRLLAPTSVAATLPRLTYRPASGSVPAALTGSPGGRLRLAEVDALGGPSGIDVALDAQGNAVLPAGRPARGSRFAYVWRDPGGITWGAAGFVPQIRLVLGEPRLRGVWPAATVTVTVASRDGSPIGRWSQRTLSGGTQPVALYDLRSGPRGGLHRLMPDERVEVVVGGDEPVVFTVPDLALALDDGRGRLSGRLPTGTRGTLAVLEPVDGDADPLRPPDAIADGTYTHRATLPINAAPDGTFAVALAGLRDLDGHALPAHRLVLYAVTAERPDGHAFMAVVGRPWVRITGWWSAVEGLTVEGFGPSGQAAAIEVADAAGRPVVRAPGVEPDGPDGPDIDQPLWRARLTDAVGAATALRTGDRVTATVGAASTALTVPPMDAYVDLERREVRGRAVPSAALTLRLWGDEWGERRWVVRAGADGAFAMPLPADVPLQHGDAGEILFRDGPHLVAAPVAVPAMLVDLSAGRLWGRGVAGAPVDVTVLRGGRPIATGRRRVDEARGYDLDPVDGAGRRVAPAPGDEIVQRVAGRPALTVTVPALSARWDAGAGAILGAVPPDGRLEVRSAPGADRFGQEWSLGWPDVASTGAFTVTARHARGLTTGLGALLHARVPSGVEARRWVVTPILNVPHGGDGVCGQAMPWARVHVDATTAGATARGDGAADASGRFRVPLRRADGRPVILAAGDVVRAEVDGEALRAKLPVLTFRVDRTQGRASGTAPPGATVSIEHPAGSCGADDGAGSTDFAWLYANPLTAGPDGTYAGALPALPPDAAATRPPAFEAALFDAAGHRHFRLSRALRLTALVDQDRVVGEADAGSTVAVTLTRPGDPPARGTAVADAVGRFTATLAADGGAIVRLRAGDRVDATTSGETRGLTVPPLAVDWRPDTGLTGRTDPGATVTVRLVLPRGLLIGQAADVAFPLTADAAGRFASAAASSRGAWTAADVRRVEVWRSLAEDDRAMVAFDTGDGPGPGATPGPGGTPGGGGVGRALLPWAGR